MPSRDSVLTRSIEPLFAILWPLFLAWTAVVLVLWMTGFNEDGLKAAIANAGLRDALGVILRSADCTWLILATLNLYLALAERVGLGTARLWAVAILAAGAFVAVLSVRTGWPLGPVAYTTRLGLKLGPVPLGWPLWWFVVVIGGRFLAERILPRASHAQIALATGAIALLTALNLEPLAWKVRLFWFWYEAGSPVAAQPFWRNFATWWLVATALAFLLRENRVTLPSPRSLNRPAAVLILFNAVFLLTHATAALRH